MPRQIGQTSKQDKQSIAMLSVLALCLKLLLPIFASFFISVQATAATPDDSANDINPTLQEALSFICTPNGLDKNLDNGSGSGPTTQMDHCDHCLTCAFYSLQRNTDKLTSASLTLSPLSWQVIKSKQAKLPFDDHRHSSRAPPRA
ncbi:hypothetical protein WH95_04610 [Kiloniella litopenaei]|uniref:DUF2946 domain-containing protein n=1 Tax=Kiloniella litopenaei TaxID=1549748 RepID=A0A0M2RBF0_9PROT|nr:hypothetical protein [Kiloniella litopenaei]KKJ77734.1 hypothetical protein WH95_04610 [Kiloniella litopenaei]